MTPLRIALLLACAGLAVTEAVPSSFQPLDMTAVMNADPTDPETAAPGGAPVPEIPYLFFEAERLFRAEGAEAVAMEGASQGEAVRGFSSRGDWAEWAFDAPFDSDEAVLHLRVLPTPGLESGGTSDEWLTVLAPTLNERPGRVVYVPSWPKTGQAVIVQAPLGHIRMGRQLLRLSVRMEGQPITIDCAWIGFQELEIRNELSDAGRIHPPHPSAAVVFEAGRIKLGEVPFDLVDRNATKGKAVAIPGPDGLTLALEGKSGDALYILGAGRAAEGTVLVTVSYTDGETDVTPVKWRSLYTRRPAEAGEVTVPLGQLRRGAVRTVPLHGKPIDSISLRAEGEGRALILAATLYKQGKE